MLEIIKEIYRTHSNWFRRNSSKSSSSNSKNRRELNLDNLICTDNLIKKNLYLEQIYQKGIYYLYDGKIKTYRSTNNRKEFITEIYNTGDFFGDPSLFDSTSKSDFVMALEDATIYLIPTENFRMLLGENTIISNKKIKKRTVKREDHFIQSTFNYVKKIMVGTIFTFSKNKKCQFKNTLTLPIQSKSKGLIKIKKGEISIMNYDGLCSLEN